MQPTELHYEWLSQGVESSPDDAVKDKLLSPLDASLFLNADKKVRQQAGNKLVECLKQYGFAVLTNTMFSQEDFDGLMAQSRGFFDLPDFEKTACKAAPEPSAALRGEESSPPTLQIASGNRRAHSKGPVLQEQSPSHMPAPKIKEKRSPSPGRAKQPQASDRDHLDEEKKAADLPVQQEGFFSKLKKRLSGHHDDAAVAEAVPADFVAPVQKQSDEGVISVSFARPMDHHMPMMKTTRGYGEFLSEGLNLNMGPDQKETFDYGLALDADGKTHLGSNMFPAALPDMEKVAMDYLHKGLKQGLAVLHAISLGLGLEEGIFDSHFEKPMTIQRLLRYPPQRKNKSKSIGAGSHVDFGALTLLYQEQPGLEILLPDQTWHAVKAPPGALILNTGFLLEKLTGGVLPATQHRVVNRTGGIRYSTALFLDPHPQAQIKPVLDGHTGKNYKECVAGHKGVRYYGSGYSTKPNVQ